MLGDRVLFEVLSQLSNLRIGQPAVSFANRQKIASRFIPHCKRIIAQHVIPLAVAKLSRDNHHIQRCQLFLELKPKPSARSGKIKTFRILDHQTFVQAPASVFKRLFNLSGRMSRDYTRSLKLGRQSYAVEISSPFAQRSC